MQIPILNGIYTDTNADFRTLYPRNLVPVPKAQGISAGYLRPADGIVEFGTGPGVDRGAINWKGILFRVMGSKLVSVDPLGNVSVLAEVGNNDLPVTFDYSFDRLGIASNNNLFYWNGSTLTQVTDTDLGKVVDFIFIDGYFFITDGTNLIVTELTDATQINPLKYGSAEADPDPVVGIVKIRNEAYAVGRYTIEVFDNVGGNNFPFQRIPGAQVMRGALGTFALCEFFMNDVYGVAFLGSGKKEPPAIWFGINGGSTQISTREIDTILQTYSEYQLAAAILESKIDKNHAWLYVHLPDQTLVYDAKGSVAAGEPVWYVLTSAVAGFGKYRARNFIWCYDKWISGDPTTNKLGYFVNNVSTHYAQTNEWEFGTMIVYNEAKGAIFHELELIALTGNYDLSKKPTIWTSYSTDGKTWSQERPRTAGVQGKYDTRLNWLQQGNMKNWRIQKFRGNSDVHASFAKLEARVEPLAN